METEILEICFVSSQQKKSESVCLKYDFSVGDNEGNDDRYNNIKRKDNSHTTQKLKLLILSVKLEYNQT